MLTSRWNSLVVLLIAVLGTAGILYPLTSVASPASETWLSTTDKPSLPASPRGSKEKRYIVVFDDKVKHPGAVAEAQVAKVDGEVSLVFRSALKGYAATLPKDEVETLKADPRVAYITPDRKVEVFSQSIPSGIDRINASDNDGLRIDSESNLLVDADVAVIDTGIDFEHPDLAVVARTDCVQESESSEAECVDDSGVDGNSHGTHVAGTIAALDNDQGVVGVAPGARLWGVKVLDDGGSGYESWVVAGVDWVTAHADQIEVANMSLGCQCSMPALEEAINASVAEGIVYVVAAGNDGIDAKDTSPSVNPHALTVSAIADYDGKAGSESVPTCGDYGVDDWLASFSNYGNVVDVAAPGVCIHSTVPGGYATYSGTSMAAPHVAGAAAILASRENPVDLEGVEAIRETIEEEGNFGWVDTSGDGILEPLLDVGDEAIFNPRDQVAVTQGATANSPSMATLYGEINPGGVETKYQFEYGKTTAYGSKAPASPVTVGSGAEYAPVSDALEGLEGHTLYHYRVTASNANGTFYGKDRVFGTTPPAAITKAPTGVTANAADLTATVNAEGLPTVYRFEFGKTDGYGRSTPNEGIGSGLDDVEVGLMVDHFNGEATYHFRVVATNAAGTTYGDDETFVTPPSDWAVRLTPNPEEGPGRRLESISCASESDCLAIGYNGHKDLFGFGGEILSERWDGEKWTITPLPDLEEEFEDEVPSASLSGNPTNGSGNRGGISCASKEWCVAVGGVSIGAPGPGQFFAPSYPLIAHWNGSEWSVDKSTTEAVSSGGRFHDISCVSSSFCIAVGAIGTNKTFAMSWSGEEWTPVTMPEPTEHEYPRELHNVSCASQVFCIAIGRYYHNSTSTAFAEQWDGEKWSLVPAPTPGLADVSCAGAEPPLARCLAIGRHVWSWDGEEWSEVEPPLSLAGAITAQYRSVSCAAPTACVVTGVSCEKNSSLLCMAVGLDLEFHKPLAASWNGSTWLLQTTTAPSFPEGKGSVLEGVSCVEPDACVAVGFDLGVEGESTLAEHLASPRVSTEAANEVGRTEATLKATVNPEGRDTSYQFEYGESTAYGAKVPAVAKGIGAGDADIDVSEQVGDLEPGAIYHFRIVASNAAGTRYGADQTFQTSLATATTDPPTEVGPFSARLNGTVDPEGLATTYQFEYGTSTEYGSSIPIHPSSAGAGTEEVEVDREIAGLEPGTTYHYRVVATNSAGTTYGENRTLRTAEIEIIHPETEESCDHNCILEFKGSYHFSNASSGTECGHEFSLNVNHDGALEASNHHTFSMGFGCLIAPCTGESATWSGHLTGYHEGVASLRLDACLVDAFNPPVESKVHLDLTQGEEGSDLEAQTQHYDPSFEFEGQWDSGDGVQFSLSQPSVTTKAATEIGMKRATLEGIVNPNGAETEYWFEYGTTTSFGKKAPISAQGIGWSAVGVDVNQEVAGLTPGVKYSYRLVAASEEGTSHGQALSFTTPGPWTPVADVDGDDRSDLVSLDGAGTPHTFRGTAQGFDLSNPVLSLEEELDPALLDGEGHYVLDVADVDGDGRGDLVTLTDEGEVFVHRGQAGGGFAEGVEAASGQKLRPVMSGDAYEPVAVADVTGDDRADLVFFIEWPGPGELLTLVFPGKADGTFANPQAAGFLTGSGDSAFLDGSGHYFLGVTDIDRDGRGELISLNSEDHGLYVFWANANGDFDSEATLISEAEIDPIFDDGEGQEVVGLGDVDGDGIADLLTLDGSTLALHLFNEEENLFDAPIDPLGSPIESNLTGGEGLELIGLLDYSRDGRADLVALDEEGDVLVFEAQSDGTFAEPTKQTAGLSSVRTSPTGHEFITQKPLIRRAGCGEGGCAWPPGE